LFASEDLIASANTSLGDASSYIRLEPNKDREYISTIFLDSRIQRFKAREQLASLIQKKIM
jgi:hypothetical protein